VLCIVEFYLPHERIRAAAGGDSIISLFNLPHEGIRAAAGAVAFGEDSNIKKAVKTVDSLITVKYLPYSYGGVSAEIDSVPVKTSPNSARGKALEQSNQTKRATNKIYLKNKAK